MANARSARAGRVWIAGATRRALTATPCRARHWSMMAYTPRISERCGSSTPCRRRHSRSREFGQPRIPRHFAIVATLLLLCTGASCCSPASDCQMTDYDMDADGRYWIFAEGELIQVPPDKILQRADNPTGRGVACLRHDDGHPVVRCFVRASEG